MMWGKEITQLWFVTFVTHNSRKSQRMTDYQIKTGDPVLFSHNDRQLINSLITQACTMHKINLFAKIVLKDHVHLILEAKDEKQLSDSVRKIKGYSSYQFQKRNFWKRKPHIWAQKFNRKPITDEEALSNILSYIEGNQEKHNSG